MFTNDEHTSTALRVYLDITENDATIHITGDLDCYSAGGLREALDQVAGLVTQRVQLDLHELMFVDSRGIQMLIEARDRARKDSVDIRLVGPVTPIVQRVLDITGMEHELRRGEEFPTG